MSKAHAEYELEQVAGTDLTESDRHRLLAHERRQVVLEVLHERGSGVGLQELAAAVLDAEAEGAADQPTRKDVSISLHHVHLPVLDDLDVLDYDPDSQRVTVQ